MLARRCAVTIKVMISTLRERRDWSTLQRPIDVQADVLVVETEQVFNLRALGNRRGITPHDVLDELIAHASRPVARRSLIRTARDVLGGLEQIHAHVQLRNVVTGRQSSLEEEDGTASFPQYHAVNLHAHVPRAVNRVDPSVRISRMNEDLLILLEPRVHLIPEKGEVALQCGSIIGRFEVSAGCVLSDAILYHQVPANGVRRLVCRLQILHPDIRNPKPVGRRSLRFIDKENVLAVGDQLASKVRPHPARATFDVYSVLKPGPLLGGWNNRSCKYLSHLESPSFEP